ncbi:hypothetical protein DY000_02000153 [Brassica cretica]|uniref:S-locus receptor kinase C-terminal domain-containing protein n=1 Tax=Brassica cretica TaxID=69181 RepID=A0ABQ7C4W1_BRACR|nr:hypothetical protein DY000_02000153 [Brassica cretica]
MPTSFMTGSIVGKRFYKKVMTREADDGSGWTVMLDYRTLKTPSKRPLKLPSLIEIHVCITVMVVMKNYTIRDDILSTFSLATRYKSMGLPVWFSSVVLGITLVPCPLLSRERHWSLDMAIVSSSVVVKDKPRVRFKVSILILSARIFLHFSSTLRSCIFLCSLKSRISDVSYEEQDDPDGGLERRGLSVTPLIKLHVIGKRNKGFNNSGRDNNLLDCVWRNWKEGQGLEIVDTVIIDSSSPTFRPRDIQRCLQIGLLCVQARPDDRPIMSAVVFMLESEAADIPQPKPPGYCVIGNYSTWSKQRDRESCTVNQITMSIIDAR